MTPLPTVYRNVNGVYWLNRLSGFKKGKAILSYHLDDFKNVNIINKLNQNLKQCQLEGVEILGRMTDVEGNRLIFSDSLLKSIEDADDYLDKVKLRIDEHIISENMEVPNGTLDHYNNRLDSDMLVRISELDLDDFKIGNIVWSTGFKRDYSWIDLPILNEEGLPVVEDGDPYLKTFTFAVWVSKLILSSNLRLESAFMQSTSLPSVLFKC
jgi:putative flavoprotein involved in K+ transport